MTEPILALLRDPDHDRWLAFEAPRDVLCCHDPRGVMDLLATAERRARREGLHAVGFVSYEGASGLDPKLVTHPPGSVPCAWFALFSEVRDAVLPAPDADTPLIWEPSLDAAGYHRAVARIHRYIRAGDSYQVNFSYRLRATTAADGNPAWSLFRHMVAGQPDGLGAYIDTPAWAVCCASPELFFTRRSRQLESRPMKGTAPRHDDPDADSAQAHWLRESLKNRAENLMITDMVRNDVGRLAAIGSVRTTDLFRLEAHPTVWQMTSTVRGETDATVAETFRALFPAASITGAPKRRTMEIILELEDAPRGVYTGAIGAIEPNGDCRFNVAIRTAWVDKARNLAEYGVGGGILWDSDAAEEHAETVTKSRILGPGGSTFALLETLLWEPPAGFLLIDEHMARLARAADRFRRPWRPALIRRALAEAVDGGDCVPRRVRLLVDACGTPTVSVHPLDPTPQPYRVALAPGPSPVLDSPWVRHKTTRRHIYEQARAAALARDPGIHDVLLRNDRGELTESTIANLVVDLDGTLVTPAEHCGLLPGVFRQHLLAGGEIVEGILRPADLRAARAIYLVNSLRRRWPITVIDA